MVDEMHVPFRTDALRFADGIWWAEANEAISYPSGGHEKCAEVEDASFWFRHRNRCITAVLERWAPHGVLFDVGGGNGAVATAMTQAGFETVLVEPAAAGARNAQRRGVTHVVCATTHAAEFGSGSLPAIGLFDVVEHVRDENGFIRHIHGLLAPGGRLYVTVPAYQALWSHEDVAAGHVRRHSLTSIAQVLRQARFHIEYETYIFWFLPAAVLVRRTIPYRLGLTRAVAHHDAMARDHAVKSSRASHVFERLLSGELEQIRAGRTLPFGGSCLLVARKLD
jgi:SAM-dependent methyltransferase